MKFCDNEKCFCHREVDKNTNNNMTLTFNGIKRKIARYEYIMDGKCKFFCEICKNAIDMFGED